MVRGKQGSNHILGARNLVNITGKIGEIGKMWLLSGGPRWRGVEQGKCQGLMVGEKGKLLGY